MEEIKYDRSEIRTIYLNGGSPWGFRIISEIQLIDDYGKYTSNISPAPIIISKVKKK